VMVNRADRVSGRSRVGVQKEFVLRVQCPNFCEIEAKIAQIMANSGQIRQKQA